MIFKYKNNFQKLSDKIAIQENQWNILIKEMSQIEFYVLSFFTFYVVGIDI